MVAEKYLPERIFKSESVTGTQALDWHVHLKFSFFFPVSLVLSPGLMSIDEIRDGFRSISLLNWEIYPSIKTFKLTVLISAAGRA